MRRPLTALIDVVSLDGNPLVRVALFPHELLSLETINEVEHISAAVGRRLEKFLRVLGTAHTLTFLGYSLGTIVALDLLAAPSKAERPWVDTVEAVVALGGVIHGSHLADVALDPSSGHQHHPLHRQVNLLRSLASSLEEPRGQPSFRRLATIASNTRAWFRFSRGYSAILIELAAAGKNREISRLLQVGRKTNVAPSLAGPWSKRRKAG